ncbi:hypothetical protein [Pedococcus bigeumensis]|uniref:Uncharacterized protein n=1 Tax=Pedococcus bigeumensis TaxID=433644 RepID=A0A502CWZ6_9MICO|nr:hypothetical protein [Pedococcus bigeumensis]TPG17333.1 hypothetical protein EAH86_11375 [Pedococcus bigeumensis]
MTTTPRTEDTAQLPWAQTETLPTTTIPYAAGPASPPASPPSTSPARDEAESALAGSAPTTAPALNPPTWTGRKTAIAAALAIGISSMGAVAAAAALPVGTSVGGGQVQQGGFGRGGQLPGGGTGPQGGFGRQGGTVQQGQGGPGALQQAPADPNASTP